MSEWVNVRELKGNLVTLRPMQAEDRNELLSAASDGNLWELWYTSVPSSESIDAYIKGALAGREAGEMYPFVVIDNVTGKIIGSTRYCSITPQHKRLEIGYTWYSQSYQRTGVNTECKLLLLSHAFGHLGCICVQFKTHWHNRASRKAIERLGAKCDGVLRNDRLAPTGVARDTVVYSIIDSEWPAVEQAIRHMQ